jgi:hypothetical protein
LIRNGTTTSIFSRLKPPFKEGKSKTNAVKLAPQLKSEDFAATNVTTTYRKNKDSISLKRRGCPKKMFSWTS